jgi:hypothetical protein
LYFLVYQPVLREYEQFQLAHTDRIVQVPDLRWRQPNTDADAYSNTNADANADADADANAGGGAGADSENGPLEIEIDHAHGRDHWQLHTSGEPAITVDGGSYTVVLGQV